MSVGVRWAAEQVMDSERREQIRRWRDAWLVKMHGDEGAAARLSKAGPVGATIEAALAIEPPTAAEQTGVDLQGEPLSPSHPWWGYQGMSAVEKRARKEGLPWPPDDDPNPYGSNK